MVRRAPEAGPWSGLSVQSVALVQRAVSLVSCRIGVWKSKGRPSRVHPSNRKPSRCEFFCGGEARVPVFTVVWVDLAPLAGSKRTVYVARSSVCRDGLVEAESALLGLFVGDDRLFGLDVVGLRGEAVVRGEGEGSGVSVALLGRVAGVCLVTRGV